MESHSERIVKIGVDLPKLWPKTKWLFFGIVDAYYGTFGACSAVVGYIQWQPASCDSTWRWRRRCQTEAISSRSQVDTCRSLTTGNSIGWRCAGNTRRYVKRNAVSNRRSRWIVYSVIAKICYEQRPRGHTLANRLHSASRATNNNYYYNNFYRAMRLFEQIVALLPWCSSVCMSVRLSVWDGLDCDHTVHVSADLSLRLDNPMFWAPWHQSMSTYSQPSFSSSTMEERWGMDKCKLSTTSQ